MMEQFDILAANGEWTGLIADKGTMLSDGQFYLGVHVYIYDAQGRFLLQRRALDKTFRPGGWDTVLGHVIAGESSAECALRETHEEVGLALREDQLRLAGRINWDVHHHMIDVYFAEIEYDLNSLVLQAEEVIGAKSVSARDMVEIAKNMSFRPEDYRALIIREIEKI